MNYMSKWTPHEHKNANVEHGERMTSRQRIIYLFQSRQVIHRTGMHHNSVHKIYAETNAVSFEMHPFPQKEQKVKAYSYIQQIAYFTFRQNSLKVKYFTWMATNMTTQACNVVIAYR